MSTEVLAFLRTHGECTIDMLSALPITTRSNTMIRLVKLGVVARRKVRRDPNSTREQWAFRLIGYPMTLKSYSLGPSDTIKEPMHFFLLRNLGRSA